MYPKYSERHVWTNFRPSLDAAERGVWLKSLEFASHPAVSLRKHTYSNVLQILQPKTENFQIRKPDIFHISDQNIDCEYSLEPPRWGGSNEYLQSMFWGEKK